MRSFCRVLAGVTAVSFLTVCYRLTAVTDVKRDTSRAGPQLLMDHFHFIDTRMAEEVADGASLHRSHSSSLGRRNSNASQQCQEWVSRAAKPPYFLTAVLLVRIYEKDKAKLTTRELRQWLQYLRYAGVEHVYVYDAWVDKSESQLILLDVFVREGFITYIDWHTHNPYSIVGTQVAAYQHCIDNYSKESHWQVAIDIDEYPFSLDDTDPGFLYRYVKHFSDYHPQVSEITMQNYLFLGKPLDRELLIDRLFRRTHRQANNLVKPIYKPRCVRAQVHHNRLLRGRRSMNAPSSELRMNHYWGARLQNWGEDTPEILEKTEPDYSMRPIIASFKGCEISMKPYF